MTRLKRTFVALAAALTLSLFVPGLALAATAVVFQPIPWGQWVADALTGSEATIALVVSALIATYVPAGYRLFLTKSVVDDAVHYAVASVSGAVFREVWSIGTTNQVIAQAEAYVIAHEKALADKLGGMLRPQIVAAISKLGTIPAEADALNLKAPLPCATVS